MIVLKRTTEQKPTPIGSNRPDGVLSLSGFCYGLPHIWAAWLMLSWSAWVYIRSVTALSLWPRASDTLATSAPLVMAMLAKV